MRALGPGSVSSFLKITLDAAYVVLWVLVVGLALIATFTLLLDLNPDFIPGVREAISRTGVPTGVASAGAQFAQTFSFAAVLVIVRTLRQIFMTLTAGDPFHPDNINRLRLIGLMLAAIEIGRYVVWALTARLAYVRRIEPSFSLTAWFAVLVVFVLAEVFREGARLRREAELTI